MKKQITSLLVFSALVLAAPSIQANTTPLNSSGNSTSAVASQIDLNTATVTELQRLPGVGISKAKAIVEYRDTKGPFVEVAELTEVKGIGDKMLRKIEDRVFVVK
ncbi:competence protein [Alteromonas sp. 345S023]|jgi:competence protein ComEA|uniref:Competence protein n=1 Tax=Alteromonas profundi TaxID=2696062 RepID=A0A7X5RJD3_9ALTE|nr:helix-hairpin-helix domain-containing protein [Alteromonas profundi]NDV89763.1 competence protein [Alteromonas profundi]